MAYHQTFLRSVSYVVALAFVAAALPGAAADNIVNDAGSNDIDALADGNNTVNATETTVIAYKVVATGNNGDTQRGCNADDGSPAVVSILAPAPVVASPSQLTFTDCNEFQDVSFSAPVAGDYPISVGWTDAGAGTYSSHQAAFILHVLALASEEEEGEQEEELPEGPIDEGAPTIIANVTPAPAGSGWYNIATGPPTIAFDCADLLSAIVACSANVTLGEGADQSVVGHAEDAFGNNVSIVVGPLHVDLTAPALQANVTPDPAPSGWYNIATGPPTVAWDCADALSGIANCTAASLLSAGANQSVAGYAEDLAGNNVSGLVEGIDVDLTAPAVLLPADLSVFATQLAGGPAVFAVSATDALDSDPDVECSAQSGDLFALGTTAVGCVATDEAGNEAAGAFNVTVRFNGQGFYQPVKMNKLNTVKAGSTVPLKFAIKTPGGGHIGDLAAVVEFRTQAITCTPMLSDPIQFTTTGATVLRYDATANQFIQNWQTPKTKGCVQTSVELADGTVLSALFQLK